MNKTVITILLACCTGVAMAQTPAPATSSTDEDKAKTEVVNVQDTRSVNTFCPQTGSLIKRNVDNRSARAVDCAASSPGRSYTRQDIDHTGALTTAGALQQLDPSINIRHR